MWHGKPPMCKHFRVFGCVAYSQISEGKLHPRSRKCYFIAYPEGVEGYSFWSNELKDALIA